MLFSRLGGDISLFFLNNADDINIFIPVGLIRDRELVKQGLI